MLFPCKLPLIDLLRMMLNLSLLLIRQRHRLVFLELFLLLFDRLFSFFFLLLSLLQFVCLLHMDFSRRGGLLLGAGKRNLILIFIIIVVIESYFADSIRLLFELGVGDGLLLKHFAFSSLLL